jgi:hypothetical protein
MSADVPPPTLGSLSNMSTSSPSWRANCASPSGRLYAPENSTSRRAELWARDVASRVALAKASGRLEAVIGAVALSSCEAEIMAGSEAAKEAIYLSSFLRELGMDLSQPHRAASLFHPRMRREWQATRALRPDQGELRRLLHEASI